LQLANAGLSVAAAARPHLVERSQLKRGRSADKIEEKAYVVGA